MIAPPAKAAPPTKKRKMWRHIFVIWSARPGNVTQPADTPGRLTHSRLTHSRLTHSRVQLTVNYFPRWKVVFHLEKQFTDYTVCHAASHCVCASHVVMRSWSDSHVASAVPRATGAMRGTIKGGGRGDTPQNAGRAAERPGGRRSRRS